MPAEVKEKTFSKSFCKAAQAMSDGQTKEFVWGCTLTKDKPTVTWTTEEEEEDEDYIQHTLFMRHAVLGAEVVKEERNIVEIETKGYDGETFKIPILSLAKGLQEMASLDLNFSHGVPVTFRLLNGSGPVHLSAQEMCEFPYEEEDGEDLEYTEDDATATEEDEEEEDAGKKRKAQSQKKGKGKKGKLDSTASAEDEGTEEDEEEEEDDDEESMEDEDDEDEEEEEEEEESPKKKKTKPKVKGPVKKAMKPAQKAKKGKKGKAK